MAKKAHILVTDDERAIRSTLKEILEFEGYTVTTAESGAEALKIIAKETIHLMFLDIKMKGMDGLETLKKLRESGSEIPVVMISGHGTIEIAVEATKYGAFDFLEKPPDLNRLLLATRNALSQESLNRKITKMKARLPKLPPILGDSAAIQRIKNLIDKVAPTKSRVLITGANGTGKELVARWIHEKSPRYGEAFIDVNCAAIPPDLIESELFGHEKGAFTGAYQQRKGKFELADGGTLFLDEIGDMPLEAQAKLLRALQEQQITRVGGSELINVDVRVIAATNKNLEEEIANGNFREDLYHRIGVIPLQIPPLDERKQDIPALAKAWLEKLQNDDISFANATISGGALNALQERSWSGNVRELQNSIERLAIMSSGNEIDADLVNLIMKPESTKKRDLKDLADSENDFQLFKESAERIFLEQQLEKHDWNISQTAETIGLQRSHVYNKMKKYNIER
ncbi:MAG: sigma-54-dependent Fis family transcriptional regulator [Balneolaceae bacterium]|nr:sigma-54-dependent Fis family transcriptional regulator [Balneolaceae bacterium]